MDQRNHVQAVPQSQSPRPHRFGLMYIFVSCWKVWLVVYGLYLITWQSLTSFIPITIIIVTIISLLANFFKIEPADSSVVDEVFGNEIRPVATIDTRLIKIDTSGRTSQILNSSNNSDLDSKLVSDNTESNHVNGTDIDGNKYKMVVVGHRGCGLDAPENSISAFRTCKKKGGTAVEFDVAFSKDKVPILFHDDSLQRICGINQNVGDLTFAELQKLDISVMHPLGDKFRGERIPTFDEAIQTCLSLDFRFFIDLKDSNELIIETILNAFKKYPEMYKRAIISSFNPITIYQIRSRNPKIIGCMAYRPSFLRYSSWNAKWENCEKRFSFFIYDWIAMILDVWSEWFLRNFTWWFVGLSAILFHKDCLTKEATYRWNQKNIRVYFWDVNTPLEKAYIMQGFQMGYLTDTLNGEPAFNTNLNKRRESLTNHFIHS